MRKFFSTVMLAVLCTAVIFFLASCGKPDGRYTDEYGACTYVFDGKTVVIEYDGYSESYFYDIQKRGEDEYIVFYDMNTKEEVVDALEYKEEDGCIIIGGVKYIEEK